MMIIERVNLNDREEILQISKYAFEQDDYIGGVFDRWLREGIFIKAVEDNRILGFMHIRLFDEFAWFEGIRVSKDYRRMGVAKELTLKAIEMSSKKIQRLMILENNIPSISLARKLGFREIFKFYYRIGQKSAFENIIKKYGLTKLNEELHEGYIDDWVYFDPISYKDYIYSNNQGIIILNTDPPFILSGSIDEESNSKNYGDECFIVFQRDSP